MDEVHADDFQEFLDRISECFIANDFATWRNSLRLPFSLVSVEGPVVLGTEEEVKENFELYRKACAIMSLDKIFRCALSLTRCENASWIGVFQTNLMVGNVRATAPYTSAVLLVRDDTGLIMTSMLNARGYSEWIPSRPSC